MIMSKIYFIATFLFVCISIHGQGTKIKWMSLTEAAKAQEKNPKKIMMDVYTNWCGPCKMLDQNTFQNPDVVKYVNENYYAVKFNAEGNEVIKYQGKEFRNPDFNPDSTGRNAQHELSQAFGINSYPTIIFLDETSKPIMPVIGYQTPNQLELYLKLFFNNDHQKIETQEAWEQYQSKFEFEFTGS